jgi:hypothetical protein
MNMPRKDVLVTGNSLASTRKLMKIAIIIIVLVVVALRVFYANRHSGKQRTSDEVYAQLKALSK